MSTTTWSRLKVSPRPNNRARRDLTFVLACASLAMLLTGCSTTTAADTNSPGKPLQLRLVISSVDGPCTAPVLTSDDAAPACDQAGTTTYELAQVLGEITPDSVTLSDNQESTNAVTLDLNDTDTETLRVASSKALDKNLAMVLDGRVLSAPLVKDTLTSSSVTLMFATASEAEQAVADLSASTTP